MDRKFSPDFAGDRKYVLIQMSNGRWIYPEKGHSWGSFGSKKEAEDYLSEVREEDRRYRKHFSITRVDDTP